MNKRFLISFIFTFSILTFLTFLTFSILSLKYIQSYTENGMSSVHKSYLDNIILNYTNDLLNENIRFFRSEMIRLIDRGLISDYAVIHNNKVIDNSTNFNITSQNSSVVAIPIWYDSSTKEIWGHVHIVSNMKELSIFIDKIKSFSLLFFLFSLTFVSIYIFVLIYFFNKNNDFLVAYIEAIFNNSSPLQKPYLYKIWSPLFFYLREIKINIDEQEIKNIELSKKQAIFEMARQVSHDIRSPVSALEIAFQGVVNIEEERKKLILHSIDRIRNIANDLLNKSSTEKSNSTLSKTPLTTTLDSHSKIIPRSILQTNNNENLQTIQNHLEKVNLNSVCDVLIHEKQTELKVIYPELIFQLSLSPENLEILTSISDLQRIISNIINNAVEALDKNSKLIQVYSRRYDDKITLSIQDNGHGIPDQIQSQIGNKGFSTKINQNSGHGLGLSFAKEKMREWNGELKILSRENEGTIVTLVFPAPNQN